MTLKEKFDKELGFHPNGIITKELELIADDYAIEFAEWLNTNYFQIVGKKVWTKNLDYDFCYTAKELLEIFKKEKGL
jgi:hypothetical protein